MKNIFLPPSSPLSSRHTLSGCRESAHGSGSTAAKGCRGSPTFPTFSSKRAHTGKVAVKESNQRWCSDGFEFCCDNGERLRVTFAQMLVEAHNGGNPWKVLAKIGGEPLIELMKDPENDELANNVLDGMNEYAKSVSDRELLEKEQLENIGPSIEAMLEVADENGMSDEQTNEMDSLWDRIQEGAIKNKVDKDIWQMLAKAVMHDENVSAAETEGEMRGKNATKALIRAITRNSRLWSFIRRIRTITA